MSQLSEWLKLGFAVLAFFLLLKLGASYLPDSGILGALKKVLASA